ncbi:MAG TPA: hypothetical protein DCE41_24850 [Cytophagales bacterium]|nr:hypothetical protein [Cytophagales bacterium]HAA23235.1 hypothetical protein [Cytophagales bacterium]HAP58476.1 hypothetical protein [Cytophagales bacterium]
MKKTLFFALLFTGATSLFAQEACEVKVLELVGTYEGGCKRGVAHGDGTAEGTDSYSGTWKKGFPDGSGTYTYASGDVYVGEFKKGRRDGEGTLTFSNGDEKKGFWKNDDYIGEYEKPYKVTSPPNAVNYQLMNRGDNTNRVAVQIRRNNAQVPVQRLTYNADNGLQYEISSEFGWENVEYPINLNINYTIQDQMGSGTNNVVFRCTIYQPGDWLIQLKH